jgi:hypothetical protein
MGPATAAALLFVSVTAAGATPSAPSSPDPAQAAASARKPSAVFILVDDLGALHFPQKKCRQILAALWASWV